MTIPTQDGIYGWVEEGEYHQDRGSLSYSRAKLLLPPSCPEKFHWAMNNPPKIKREWDFGHLAHKLVLGKGAEFTVLDPQIHGLKKDGTVAESPRATAGWKQAEADARARDVIPVHIDDFEKAKAMADRVLSDPDVGPVFDPRHGVAEQSVYGTDESTGVRLRCRPDWLWLKAKNGRVKCLDYKTAYTANPTELQRTFWRLGYYLQAAWYTHVLQISGVAADAEFQFIVQEKDPPYIVQVIDYDAEAMAEGARAMREAIEIYTKCRDTNTWPAYADGPVTLSLPYWAIEDVELKLA